jgi:hypothetical protein
MRFARNPSPGKLLGLIELLLSLELSRANGPDFCSEPYSALSLRWIFVAGKVEIVGANLLFNLIGCQPDRWSHSFGIWRLVLSQRIATYSEEA